MRRVVAYFLLLVCKAVLSSRVSLLSFAPEGGKVDEQLYSRQIFVYGKSAQHSLSGSHVLVRGSNSPLLAEIVKNLALAGVGKLSILNEDKDGDSRLKGEEVSLARYAHSLNPFVVATDIENAENVGEHSDAYSVVVCADKKISELIKVAQKYREQGLKVVGCNVRGLCGYVCDDFLDNFEVEDADGELSREIPLLDAALQPAKDGDDSNTLRLRIACIDEEKLGLGIGEFAEIIDSEAHEYGPFEVLAVESSKAVVLNVYREETREKLLGVTKRGKAVLKKIKQKQLVHHASLESQLKSPSFVPANGCLPPKKDRALSLCLLAAFKVIDNKPSSAAVFREEIVKELKVLGVAHPEKSVKEGGVGDEILDFVSDRFFRSAAEGGRCAATVSVIGSLASQEAIKAVTHVHVPANQLLMFESLDSLLPPPAAAAAAADDSEGAEKGSERTDPVDEAALVYGKELAAELARLRVFVVGSGAIGCELLKIFALMGVCTGTDGTTNDTPALKGLWEGLENGGIILADMDNIERSNLNRQLLFREKHVGSAKALVASETIKQINPNIRVKAAVNKLCPETEVLFDSEFWTNVDVVATALDNVDARRYVDSQCVAYRRWLLDSGTLGTKGNTQVIIPHVSESYSSSADPPEEAIPMCTLKSFPYLPEHSIAWARSFFDQLFSADIQCLMTALQASPTANSGDDDQGKDGAELKKMITALEELSLSPEDVSRLYASLNTPFTEENSTETLWAQVTPKGAIQWALRLFDNTFRADPLALLKEHPLNEKDDEGVPFWGGSRRVPTALHFDPSDATHRSFVLWAAALRGRICGQKNLHRPHESALVSALDSVLQERVQEQQKEHSPTASPGANALESVAKILVSMGAEGRNKLLKSLEPEDFEKDEAELGHVDFATAAANLRCRVYSLREVDRLEVQKVAGRIVPALATTTSLVSGLTCLELLKVASERILARRRAASKNNAPKKGLLSAAVAKAKAAAHIEASHEHAGIDQKKADRLLQRFRNSFVNLARPMLAFAQPVEVEAYHVKDERFTMWDTVEAPYDAKHLTIAALKKFIVKRFGGEIMSISAEDQLLYADFMESLDGDEDDEESAALQRKSIWDLIREAEQSTEASAAQRESEDPREKQQQKTKATMSLTSGAKTGKAFIDLEVICSDEEGEGDDLRIPAVRVRLTSTSTESPSASKKSSKSTSGASTSTSTGSSSSKKATKANDSSKKQTKAHSDENPDSSPKKQSIKEALKEKLQKLKDSELGDAVAKAQKKFDDFFRKPSDSKNSKSKKGSDEKKKK